MLRRYAMIRQNDASDCGAAALATVSLYHRMPIGLEQVRDLAGTDSVGTNLWGLAQAAGMPVRVKLDAYDYQKYGSVPGRVVFVAPDSEFQATAAAQRPPSYTVKISLAGDRVGRGRHHGRIKLGMTGMAEIVTDRESILSLLVRSIRQSISLG